MKIFIIMLAGLAALLSPALVRASDNSVPSLQKQVRQAQSNFDHAKEKAESGMTSSGKAEWERAQAKWDALLSQGADADKIASQKNMLTEIESRVMPSSDRESVDDARDVLAQAGNRLRVAQQKNSHDDSSQAIQPENRTQNGSNFSIRSQRDSENHPPLPSSQ